MGQYSGLDIALRDVAEKCFEAYDNPALCGTTYRCAAAYAIFTVAGQAAMGRLYEVLDEIHQERGVPWRTDTVAGVQPRPAAAAGDNGEAA